MKKLLCLGLFVAALSIVSIGSAQNAVNQQKSTTPPQKKVMPAIKKAKTVYTCPMHPEVAMDKPGKCPKCGMNLVKKEAPAKMQMTKTTYTCPMHPEVAMDKPGKCPKCGMNLVKKATNTKAKV